MNNSNNTNNKKKKNRNNSKKKVMITSTTTSTTKRNIHLQTTNDEGTKKNMDLIEYGNLTNHQWFVSVNSP